MNTKIRISRFIIMLALGYLFAGCYEFNSIDQPEEIDPGESFQIVSEISENAYNFYSAAGLYSIMLPENWLVVDSIEYVGSDVGVYHFSQLYSDSMEYYDPAIDGYQWWTFICDTLSDLEYRDVHVSLTINIQADVETGVYFIDHRLGYIQYDWEGNLVSTSMYRTSDNSNPIWVGLDPFPLVGDMYVSVNGSDTNTGVSEDQPLKTISAALERIVSDEFDPRTVFVNAGEYSWSTNGEQFPIMHIPDHVSIIGDQNGEVILNGEGYSGHFFLRDKHGVTLSNLTLIGGSDLAAVYCAESDVSLSSMIIQGNTSDGRGGGIFCQHATMDLSDVRIIGNTAPSGGGVHGEMSTINFENVTISGNSAEQGGGIFNDQCNMNFSAESLGNIHSNIGLRGGRGVDIYSNTNMVVAVDTFTVDHRTDYYLHPHEIIYINQQHSVRELTNSDLYVSPDGNDTNDGLTGQTSLKTIHSALSKLWSDASNPSIIHLASGRYSPTETGEYFPIALMDHVSLIGEDRQEVILSSDSTSAVMEFNQTTGSFIENLTLTEGTRGVECVNSNPHFRNVTISKNGGASGFHCLESSPVLRNVLFENNTGGRGGGMNCVESNPNLVDVSFSGNHSNSHGGGLNLEFSSAVIRRTQFLNNSARLDGGGIRIHVGEPGLLLDSVTVLHNTAKAGGGIGFAYCRDNPTLRNLVIAENSTTEFWGGGISCEYANLTFTNTTIAGNVSVHDGGGIRANWEVNITLRNSILWDNSPEQVHCNQYGGTFSLTVTGSAIQNGENGIEINDFGTLSYGDSNISSNPEFCNSWESDYHLASTSPCAGTGTGGVDMGGLGVGCTSPVSIGNKDELPRALTLRQNFPNPFNPVTTISYDLPEQTEVEMVIYNLKGRRVNTLVQGQQNAGEYSVQWDGLDQRGHPVSTGLYLCHLQAGSYSQSIKMLLMK